MTNMLQSCTIGKEAQIQKAEGSVYLLPILYLLKTQALSLCQHLFDF